jgi:Mg2+ and Co2+ transporter CorA
MQVLTALDRDRIAGLLARDEFFWLDLTAPSGQELRELAEVLELEQQAVMALGEESKVPRRPGASSGPPRTCT